MRHSRLLNLSNRVYLKLSSQTIFKLNSLSGLRPRPMQGEVSPYDPLFSAHPASSSQRSHYAARKTIRPGAIS
jgi:hypothetical protein